MSVYFISNGPLIKIGKSKDPEARVRALQTGSGERLRLLAVAEIASERESTEVESSLHVMFGWCRRHGEFFSATAPLRQLIAAVAAGVPVKPAMALADKACVKRRRKSRITFEVMRSRVANPSI